MTITIRENTVTGTILIQTTTPSGALPPEVYLKKGSFNKTTKPRWVTQQSNGREGDFKHYNGSGDSSMPVIFCLWGANRKTNLATLLGLGNKILYLVDGDVDSNNNGTYVMVGNPQVSYDEEISKIEVRMNWEKYNN